MSWISLQLNVASDVYLGNTFLSHSKVCLLNTLDMGFYYVYVVNFSDQDYFVRHEGCTPLHSLSVQQFNFDLPFWRNLQVPSKKPTCNRALRWLDIHCDICLETKTSHWHACSENIHKMHTKTHVCTHTLCLEFNWFEDSLWTKLCAPCTFLLKSWHSRAALWCYCLSSFKCCRCCCTCLSELDFALFFLWMPKSWYQWIVEQNELYLHWQ